ncbi:HNH endonuclease, partial [Dietzia sp. DQ11-44]|nr:HNH endonuclease [Dietzia sp. DQ11-44]
PAGTPRAADPPPAKAGPPPLTSLEAPILPFGLLRDLDHAIHARLRAAGIVEEAA